MKNSNNNIQLQEIYHSSNDPYLAHGIIRVFCATFQAVRYQLYNQNLRLQQIWNTEQGMLKEFYLKLHS